MTKIQELFENLTLDRPNIDTVEQGLKVLDGKQKDLEAIHIYIEPSAPEAYHRKKYFHISRIEIVCWLDSWIYENLVTNEEYGQYVDKYIPLKQKLGYDDLDDYILEKYYRSRAIKKLSETKKRFDLNEWTKPRYRLRYGRKTNVEMKNGTELHFDFRSYVISLFILKNGQDKRILAVGGSGSSGSREEYTIFTAIFYLLGKKSLILHHLVRYDSLNQYHFIATYKKPIVTCTISFNLDLDGTYYVLDSTSIDLCLSVFGWARYKSKLGAVKIHTQMDLRGSIPTFFHITDGKVNDMNFLDLIDYEVGAYYIMDRGYIDYARLYKINQAGAFFVIRAVRNTVWKRIYSNAVDRSNGLRCDQVIRLTSKQGRERYPAQLRRIKYYDEQTNHYYVFFTNDFNIGAQSVADLYKHRWQIELFFKWIKQHLKIKTFWGQSENAVKTQICIAICSYLIVAILKKRLGIERSLYEILQILSVSLFDKTPLVELFSEDQLQSLEDDSQNMLPLLGF